jgi:hypothetical protein
MQHQGTAIKQRTYIQLLVCCLIGIYIALSFFSYLRSIIIAATIVTSSAAQEHTTLILFSLFDHLPLALEC